jgi:hypothetical protein
MALEGCVELDRVARVPIRAPAVTGWGRSPRGRTTPRSARGPGAARPARRQRAGPRRGARKLGVAVGRPDVLPTLRRQLHHAPIRVANLGGKVHPAAPTLLRRADEVQNRVPNRVPESADRPRFSPTQATETPATSGIPAAGRAIIIRVSGVRVPPPASRKALQTQIFLTEGHGHWARGPAGGLLARRRLCGELGAGGGGRAATIVAVGAARACEYPPRPRTGVGSAA